jgi:hypothetical protein
MENTKYKCGEMVLSQNLIPVVIDEYDIRTGEYLINGKRVAESDLQKFPTFNTFPTSGVKYYLQCKICGGMVAFEIGERVNWGRCKCEQLTILGRCFNIKIIGKEIVFFEKHMVADLREKLNREESVVVSESWYVIKVNNHFVMVNREDNLPEYVYESLEMLINEVVGGAVE